MVTFTCNNCGDSVKKNRVEKHFSFECRRKTGGPNVCCIDCLKDFRENYDAHTSCQTEEERYSAKGTFVAKEAKNKQMKKQSTWSEIIQNIATTNKNLSLDYKDILDLIKDNDNVPRKEAKFKNFCKNNAHLRRFAVNDVMGVFNLIQVEMKKNEEINKIEREKALAAAKEKKNQEKSEPKKRSNSESEQIEVETKKQKIDSEDNSNKKEKKNKKINVDNKENNATPVSVEEEKKKKKKKKKTKGKDVEMSEVAESNNVQESKSEKKKKISENKAVEETNGTTVRNGVSKKKKKNAVEQGTMSNGTAVTNGVGKKTKKNKREKKSVANTSVTEEQNTSLKEKSPNKKRNSLEAEKTPFKEIVVKLLKPGNEIKLKSLKKMVFASYKSGDEEVPRDVRENFNKKLLKIPNVEMNEKIVKMVK